MFILFPSFFSMMLSCLIFATTVNASRFSFVADQPEYVDMELQEDPFPKAIMPDPGAIYEMDFEVSLATTMIGPNGDEDFRITDLVHPQILNIVDDFFQVTPSEARHVLLPFLPPTIFMTAKGVFYDVNYDHGFTLFSLYKAICDYRTFIDNKFKRIESQTQMMAAQAMTIQPGPASECCYCSVPQPSRQVAFAVPVVQSSNSSPFYSSFSSSSSSLSSTSSSSSSSYSSSSSTSPEVEPETISSILYFKEQSKQTQSLLIGQIIKQCVGDTGIIVPSVINKKFNELYGDMHISTFKPYFFRAVFALDLFDPQR